MRRLVWYGQNGGEKQYFFLIFFFLNEEKGLSDFQDPGHTDNNGKRNSHWHGRFADPWTRPVWEYFNIFALRRTSIGIESPPRLPSSEKWRISRGSSVCLLRLHEERTAAAITAVVVVVVVGQCVRNCVAHLNIRTERVPVYRVTGWEVSQAPDRRHLFR